MGGKGAAGLITWLSLLYSAAWLVFVNGQRDRELELAAVVRLVGGIDDSEGIVEITYGGRTGKLCNIGISEADAVILCRMIGEKVNGEGAVRLFENPARIQGFYPEGSSQRDYILSGLECDRQQDNTIADCDFEEGGGWSNTVIQGCNPLARTNDVAIQCFSDQVVAPVPTPTPSPEPAVTIQPVTVPTICDNPSTNVRLRGGLNAQEGRVEVRRTDGSFGAVCDNNWGKADAQVICRMLCYDPQYAQARINTFGNTDVPFYLTDVQCDGAETDILDCDESIITSNSPNQCALSEVASVSCFESLPDTAPAPEPIVDCTGSRITAKFNRQKEPRLRVEYLSLRDNVAPDCGYTESVDTDYVVISIPFVGCGTDKSKTNVTHITYSNTIRHAVPPESSIITRTTIYYIDVTCYIRRDVFPEKQIEPSARTAPPVDGSGRFNVDMILYRSNAFTAPIQVFPARVTLGDWLYVGLSLNTADRNLKLIVPECKATAEEDQNSQPQYYFIDQKCRVEDSVIFYSFNQSFFAFRFQTFKFVGDRPYVYVHCTSYVCNQDERDAECDRSCNIGQLTRQKRSAMLELPSDNAIVPHKKWKRAVTRPLFESDKGPIELVNSDGSLIKLDRQLKKPKPILTGGAAHLGACTTITLLTIMLTSYII